MVAAKTQGTGDQAAGAARASGDGDLSARSKQVMELVEAMSVLELAGLVKALEERFGVSAAVPVMAAAPAAGAGQPAAVVEEKTTFNVVLAKVGDNKIQVIKEIRAVTNLGLKEAKELVEAAPKVIKEGVPKAEAEEMKKKVAAAGATVELQ